MAISAAAVELEGDVSPISETFNQHSGLNDFEAIPVNRPVYDVILAAKNAQTIHFGDNNHDNNQIKATFAAPEMMDALAASGTKHIMLEIPVEQEKYLKAYQGGEMSREDFIDKVSDRWETGFYDSHARERGEMTADIVDRAAARGMSTHFVDGSEGVTERYKAAYRGPLNDALTDYAQKNGLTKREVGAQLSDPQTAPTVNAHIMRHLQDNNPDAIKILVEDSIENPEFMKKRIGPGVDSRLAARIEAAANGEKTAVFYGSAHQIGQNLQNGSSMKVDIVGDAMEAEGRATGFKSDVSTDFAVSAKDGKVFQSPHANLGTPAPAPPPTPEIQRVQPTTTPQQYQMMGTP